MSLVVGIGKLIEVLSLEEMRSEFRKNCHNAEIIYSICCFKIIWGEHLRVESHIFPFVHLPLGARHNWKIWSLNAWVSRFGALVVWYFDGSGGQKKSPFKQIKTMGDFHLKGPSFLSLGCF